MRKLFFFLLFLSVLAVSQAPAQSVVQFASSTGDRGLTASFPAPTTPGNICLLIPTSSINAGDAINTPSFSGTANWVSLRHVGNLATGGVLSVWAGNITSPFTTITLSNSFYRGTHGGWCAIECSGLAQNTSQLLDVSQSNASSTITGTNLTTASAGTPSPNDLLITAFNANTLTSPTNGYSYLGSQVYGIGEGTYIFTISNASVSAGAVYNNNGVNYTVAKAITNGTTLQTSSTSAGPAPAGNTLTLVSGNGPSTLTFSSASNNQAVSCFFKVANSNQTTTCNATNTPGGIYTGIVVGLKAGHTYTQTAKFQGGSASTSQGTISLGPVPDYSTVVVAAGSPNHTYNRIWATCPGMRFHEIGFTTYPGGDIALEVLVAQNVMHTAGNTITLTYSQPSTFNCAIAAVEPPSSVQLVDNSPGRPFMPCVSTTNTPLGTTAYTVPTGISSFSNGIEMAAFFDHTNTTGQYSVPTFPNPGWNYTIIDQTGALCLEEKSQIAAEAASSSVTINNGSKNVGISFILTRQQPYDIKAAPAPGGLAINWSTGVQIGSDTARLVSSSHPDMGASSGDPVQVEAMGLPSNSSGSLAISIPNWTPRYYQVQEWNGVSADASSPVACGVNNPPSTVATSCETWCVWFEPWVSIPPGTDTTSTMYQLGAESSDSSHTVPGFIETRNLYLSQANADVNTVMSNLGLPTATAIVCYNAPYQSPVLYAREPGNQSNAQTATDLGQYLLDSTSDNTGFLFPLQSSQVNTVFELCPNSVANEAAQMAFTAAYMAAGQGNGFFIDCGWAPDPTSALLTCQAPPVFVGGGSGTPNPNGFWENPPFGPGAAGPDATGHVHDCILPVWQAFMKQCLEITAYSKQTQPNALVVINDLSTSSASPSIPQYNIDTGIYGIPQAQYFGLYLSDIFDSGICESYMYGPGGATPALSSWLEILQASRYYEQYALTNGRGNSVLPLSYADGTFVENFANGGLDLGNGTCGKITPSSNPAIGTFSWVCVSGGSNAVFTGVGPNGLLPTLTVGTSYSCGDLSFKVSSGSTPYSIGDTFSIVVSSPYPAQHAWFVYATAKLCNLVPANGGGSDKAQQHWVWPQINSMKLGAPVAVDPATGMTEVGGIPAGVFTFNIPTGNASAGAVYYAANGAMFTVNSTVSGGTMLVTSGNSAPNASGFLTLYSGTGDANITYTSAVANTAVGGYYRDFANGSVFVNPTTSVLTFNLSAIQDVARISETTGASLGPSSTTLVLQPQTAEVFSYGTSPVNRR